MALDWNPLGLTGVLALVLGWSAGVLVYAAAPRKTSNRLLAIILILESTGVGVARGFQAFTNDPVLDASYSAVALLMQSLMIPAYLMFYSRLDSRLARRLRAWPAQAASVAVAAGFVGWYLLRPDLLMEIYLVIFRSWTAAGLLGLLVAITVWREAPLGSQTRRQGRAYVIAFGIRDVAWFAYTWWLYPTYGLETTPAWRIFFSVFAPGITIVFVALLAHGFLRAQLFDVDLRLKRGVSQSVVGASFIAAFFLASEGTSALVESRTGSAIVGVVAAGLLVFALAPLQRAAERVADAAMPRVRDTHDYRTVRKGEVYRAAVESALTDGQVTDREREILATLADQLGLSSSEALRIEREAAAGRPAPG